MGCNQLIIHIVVIKNFILLSYKEPLKYLKRLNPLHLIHRCCLYQYSLFFIETLFIHEIMRNNDDCLCTYFIGTADNKCSSDIFLMNNGVIKLQVIRF